MIRRFAAFAAIATLALCANGARTDAQESTGRLQLAPAGAVVGTRVVAHATGLAPNARFTIAWGSGDARWRTEAGKFYGIVAPPSQRTLASGTSDASGALNVPFTVPEDFGYLHDVEVRAERSSSDAPFAATQGFTVIPHLEVSPKSGPPGTPVTITVTGLGYRFYQVVWHLMYDNARTGWLSAVTTHGTARVTIPASGEIGMHTLQAIEGPTAPYLNGQQSPNAQRYIPQVIADTFRITPGAVVKPVAAVAQTPARERVSSAPLAGSASASAPLSVGVTASASAPVASTALLHTDYASGGVGDPIVITGSGFKPSAPIVLTWETYVGNRLSGNGWSTKENPFSNAVADAKGNVSLRMPTPDDLGGPHRVIARTADDTMVFANYQIVPSVVEIEPRVVAPGAEYTIRIKGVGWSETANTYTIVLDNANIGYGCGFNSQGDATMHLRAPGRTGTHFIDLYPTIYTGQITGPGSPPSGATVNGIYFLLPMLNVVDHPGERLPAFHLAFNVR